MDETVLCEIANERQNQDNKWGEQNHHVLFWMSVLGEEYGEACKSAIEGDVLSCRTELVQVAAVAVAAIESLDRKVGE